MLHGGGGTERHARDLAAIADPDSLSYLMLGDGSSLKVEEYLAGVRLRALRFPLAANVPRHDPLGHRPYREAFETVCGTLGINLIHVHHLIHHTFDIASVAALHDIRYVMTLHDYYSVCPMYTLLDPEGHSCAACMGHEHGSVEACMAHLGHPPDYLVEYQAAMERFLNGAAQLFVPNVTVKNIIGTRYPSLIPLISVIEHGRWRAGAALENASPGSSTSSVGFDGLSTLNVAVIGALDLHKGSTVLRDLLRTNRSNQITFHLYGSTPDADLRTELDIVRRVEGSNFVYHGPYDADHIGRLLSSDGIHVGLQLAVWPETYSFTLTEFVEARRIR